MKDVAYFVGCCLSGPECEQRESELLDLYFTALRECLDSEVDGEALEAEWRTLYPLAWADFQRFMLGWSPGHRKLTDYSDATTQRALQSMVDELTTAAREACLAAAEVLRQGRSLPLEVQSKGLGTEAADVLTQVDLAAQEAILERLQPTLDRYDLGVLAEEGESDESRLEKHAFWAIDPMDGTRFFVQGQSGYAVSVALVSQAGETLLGAVYDPVNERLFEAVRGRGVRLNGRSFKRPELSEGSSSRIQCFADRSLEDSSCWEALESISDIHFLGGAVVNALSVMLNPGSVYIKPPKKALGGGAIWDFAAVSLMLEECGGTAQTFYGKPLPLNRSEGVYFNDLGVVFAGLDVDLRDLSATGLKGAMTGEPLG